MISVFTHFEAVSLRKTEGLNPGVDRLMKTVETYKKRTSAQQKDLNIIESYKDEFHANLRAISGNIL